MAILNEKWTSVAALLNEYGITRVKVLEIIMKSRNSKGSVAAGAKGKRRALQNAEIMIHQPSGGASGQATEIRIHAEQILKIRDRLNQILAQRTGQPLSVIEADTERDNFMTAEEAKTYGLVDEVIVPRR